MCHRFLDLSGPVPTICMYRTGLNTGRDTTIMSHFGASKPVVSTLWYANDTQRPGPKLSSEVPAREPIRPTAHSSCRAPRKVQSCSKILRVCH